LKTLLTKTEIQDKQKFYAKHLKIELDILKSAIDNQRRENSRFTKKCLEEHKALIDLAYKQFITLYN